MNNEIYVIKPKKNNYYGLGALIIEVLKYVQFADYMGYIPYVDWSNNSTQYSNNRIDNAWNYYFTQPIKSIEFLDHSDTIYYSKESDLSFFKKGKRVKKSFDSSTKELSRRLFNTYFSFSDEMRIKCEEEIIQNQITIGILLRGTDYFNLKPKGHAIQPSLIEVEEVVDYYLDNTQAKKIYLVTEDLMIMKSMLKKYGSKIIQQKKDYQIKNFNGTFFLANDVESLKQLGKTPKERGIQYLKKLILLSQCDYFIAGDTCGSWFSFILSNSFKDYFVFDLGKY